MKMYAELHGNRVQVENLRYVPSRYIEPKMYCDVTILDDSLLGKACQPLQAWGVSIESLTGLTVEKEITV